MIATADKPKPVVMRPDKYDAEIQRLLNVPDEEFEDNVISAWGTTGDALLFQFAGRGGRCADDNIGCITMIRDGSYEAQTSELTEAIRADERIPGDAKDITKKHLPVFAEWQRRLDVELAETPISIAKTRDMGHMHLGR